MLSENVAAHSCFENPCPYGRAYTVGLGPMGYMCDPPQECDRPCEDNEDTFSMNGIIHLGG